jgi:integrase
MSAKVKKWKGAWWVFVHHRGTRRTRRFGPKETDRRRAERIAEGVNAAITAGTYNAEEPAPLPCDEALRSWLEAHRVTMKPGYAMCVSGTIENHLAPFFGSKDLREIREEDLLAFAQAKLDAGLAVNTVRNALSALRRVYSLAVRSGDLVRNPAARMGEILRRIDRAQATEVEEVQTWTREEVEILLATARRKDPGLAPLLAFLFGTGCRRGEALALQWDDLDLRAGTATIRRSLSAGRVSTPKSGRGRRIVLPLGLVAELRSLRAQGREETLKHGRSEMPPWVFGSRVGTPLDGSRASKRWDRVRREAARHGVRSLRLHCARHTWATLALQNGKSLRWVARQLGHADPALTLRVYAHALPEEEHDLGFADFGLAASTSKRHQAAPPLAASPEEAS